MADNRSVYACVYFWHQERFNLVKSKLKREWKQERKNWYNDERNRILVLYFFLSAFPHPLSITFQSVVCCWIIDIQTRSRWWSLSFHPLFSPLASLYHLSLSLTLALPICTTAAFEGIWIEPKLRNATSLVGMDLHNQMVRLFGAINSLRRISGNMFAAEIWGRLVECVEWHSSLKSL